MRLLYGKAFDCLIMLLWNVWNSRNNLLFRGLVEQPKLVWKRALAFGRDFRIFNLNNAALLPKEIRTISCVKPHTGFIKINIDVAWLDRKAGLEYVARDSDNFVHGGGMQFTMLWLPLIGGRWKLC